MVLAQETIFFSSGLKQLADFGWAGGVYRPEEGEFDHQQGRRQSLAVSRIYHGFLLVALAIPYYPIHSKTDKNAR